MRRALAILKYLPAVLCGLLVVAWVVSLFYFVTAISLLPRAVDGSIEIGCDYGSTWASIASTTRRTKTAGVFVHAITSEDLSGFEPRYWMGKLWFSFRDSQGWVFSFQCPIPFLLTVLLPLTIGPFIRFRFPLWSWFAFTALVAVELAYYLR